MGIRRPSTYSYPPKFNKLEDAENYSKRLYAELLENDSRGEEITARATDKDLKALIVRPEWYGAKGDGVHDDTAAIQAAIDALDAGRGGTIQFAPKVYIITETINLKSNIRYVGHAQASSTGGEAYSDGTEIRWAGADGDIMVEAFDKSGILWDGINLYGVPGTSISGYIPITNGLAGIRQYSDNAPIAWRNKFRNFEVWYVDTACDFGHHTIGYESDMYEISDFNFYKVNTGVRTSSANGTQGSIIKNGRIHCYDRGIWVEQESLLVISQITFASLYDTPTHGNFIEVYDVGGQLLIEECQGEGYGLSAWNSIKFTLPYGGSAHRPTTLLANVFNAPVVVAGGYDIISIGNTWEVQATQLTRALDFTGNGINYISIGDTFVSGSSKRDTGTGNNFITIGVQGGDGDIDITGTYKVNGADLGQSNIEGLHSITGGYVPYQCAVEHISNGGFDSATAGWTAEYGTIAIVAGGYRGNCLEITRASETTQNFWQTVSDLEVGKSYIFSAYVKSGSSGDEPFQLFYYIDPSTADSNSLGGTSSATWTKYSMTITPIDTSYKFIGIKNSDTPGTMLFDSVSVVELTELADSPLSTDGTDVDNSGVYKVDAVQVVGAQGAAIADADAGSIVAQFNTLLAELRVHGLIDTA
jgi:hypothetical protein